MPSDKHSGLESIYPSLQCGFASRAPHIFVMFFFFFFFFFFLSLLLQCEFNNNVCTQIPLLYSLMMPKPPAPAAL